MSYTSRARRRAYVLLTFAYVCYAFVLLFVVSLFKPSDSMIVWGALLVGPLLTFLVMIQLGILLASWISAQGGSKTGRHLAELKASGYTVLDSLDLFKGVVDHVVIGPSGVYAVEVVRWRSRVYLGDGARLMHGRMSAQPAMKKAIDAATLVRRRLASCGLDHFVVAVVAPTSSQMEAPIDIRDVHAVTASALAGWIKRRSVKIPPAEVDRVRYALAPFQPFDVGSAFKMP